MRSALATLFLGSFLIGAGPTLAAPGDDIGAALKVVNLVTADYE